MKGGEKMYNIELNKEELNIIYSALLDSKNDYQLKLKELRESELVDDIDETIEIEITTIIAECSEIQAKIANILSDELLSDGDTPF